VKIEQPGVGDALRGPAGQVGHLDNKQQNKKSVAVNLHDPDGLELFMSLAGHADVVFSNQKPKTLARMGITFEALRERNPAIVYATLSGFGHDDLVPSGPFGDWPAFDVIAQGLAGLQFRCLGPTPDMPGYNGMPLGDDGTAIFTAFGVVLALRSRDLTGQPQRVDVAMHDAMVYFNGSSVNRWRTQGDEAPRGKSTGGSAPYGAYRTADGWVNIAVYGENLWGRFCTAIGKPDAADDPRFLNAKLRFANLQDLNSELVDPFTTSRPTEDVLKALHAQGIPAAPIFHTGQVIDSPQVQARQLFTPYYLRDGNLHETLASPVKLSSVDESVPLSAPPRLAEHTADILRQLLGLDDDRLHKLAAKGTIQVAE
jgi:CoA:oxalate CoA-transferase